MNAPHRQARTADVVVIGAGTAGLSAVDELDRLGKSVLVVDHGPLGTTCIRVGCMPSKALLHAGRRWSTARKLTDWNRADGARVRDTLWQEVGAIRAHLLRAEVTKTHEKLGKRLIIGTARFVSPDAIEVDGVRIEAGAFVIATGSSPMVPKEMAEAVLTTDTLFELDRLPASLGLIGIGNVGIELGLAMARLGVRVVAVDNEKRPAGIVDPRIAACAIKTFSAEMEMHLDVEARVRRDGDGFRLRIGEHDHAVEHVLAALGRKPNLAQLHVAAAGVAWDAEGDDEPPIDEATLRLGDRPIFVAGDASPERPLLHEAIDEGVIAARGAVAALAGSHRAKTPKRRTPFDIVFTDPDVIKVGMAFDELDHDRTIIGTAAGDHNGRSAICRVDQDPQDNLVRLYADKSDGTLLGAAAISVAGEHLAHLLALAIDRGLTAAEMLAAPFYHPTFEEMVQSALQDVVEQQHA